MIDKSGDDFAVIDAGENWSAELETLVGVE